MPTQKIDPKVIFASNAPTIDNPPVFSDKTKGWDVARANDGRPEISQMNKLQQDTDLKILWLNENSVTPYDSSIDYPDGAVAIKDGSFKQLSSGAWVEFLDDFADKDAVKRGIANRYDSSLTYNSGERVVLTNGDIVKSTINGNTNDPNSDMTGWVKTNSANQIFDESGLSLGQINLATTQSVIYAEKYGLSEISDNTSKYNQLINDAPNNAKIVFPYSKTLSGHFVSENKSFNIDFNGCTLINTVDDKSIVQIGSLSATAYNVTEATLNHGDTQFTVIGASTLFKAGDIGYLWDGAKRADGENVNYEVIKIKALAGDVITVDGFLASYKGASAIKFYHPPSQLKNPSISNGLINPTSSHTSFGAVILNSENPSIENIETTGTTGNAVAIRYCYGADIDTIKPTKPASVSSGNGYGVALMAVSKFTVKNISGSGMRHVYDQDSVYFGDLENISDDDDQSACVGLAHNGFAGYITCRNVRCTTSQYPIVLSEQGYGGTVPALKRNHPFRNIKIRNVTVAIRDTVSPDTNTTFGVYFQNSIISCEVDGIDVNFKSSTALTPAAQSSIVRINGVANGGSIIKNLRANKIGKFVFASSGTRDSFAYDYTQLVINGLSVSGDCNYVHHLQGLYYPNLDDVSISGSILSGKIGYMQAVGAGDQPYGAFHGDNIDYRLGTALQLDHSAAKAINGRLPLGTKSASSGVTVVADQPITLTELQERSSWIRLNPPVGASTISLNALTALPRPQTIGDEVFISVPLARNNVTFPAGNNINNGFTINAGEIVRLKVVGSKWSLVSRSSNT